MVIRVFIVVLRLTCPGELLVEARSEGCNDLSKGSRCGQAYILVNGKDVSRHRRGHNVAVIDYNTGEHNQTVLRLFMKVKTS